MFTVSIISNASRPALVARLATMSGAIRKARALSAAGYPVAIECANGARFFF